MKKMNLIMAMTVVVLILTGNVFAEDSQGIIYQTSPIFEESDITDLQKKILEKEMAKKGVSLNPDTRYKRSLEKVEIYIEAKKITKDDLPHVKIKATVFTEGDVFTGTVIAKEDEVEEYFEPMKEAILQAIDKMPLPYWLAPDGGFN